MDWEDRCAMARARMLVLNQLRELGVQPELWQIKKALGPVLVDVVPSTSSGSGGGGKARGPDGRFLRDLSTDVARALMPPE